MIIGLNTQLREIHENARESMLKIGALPFINSLPFFQPFAEKKVAFDGTISFGSPTTLNTQLENGLIDIGLISSASFIANRDRYILLTNLGIGTHKRMQSVCLYSKGPPDALNGKKIAISDASTTSAMLLKVICKYFWNIQPQFVETKSSVFEPLKMHDAQLIIGDDCLSLTPSTEHTVTDLGQVWYQNTGKPFVFAVFATRCDIWMQEPELVRDFHQKLFQSYEYSQSHFDEIIHAAEKLTGKSKEMLKNYYKGLDYYLESEHFQGLEHFARLKDDRPVQERLS